MKEIIDDKMHEECGVFGIFGSHEAAANTFFGLSALQHRGEESSGMVIHDHTTKTFHAHRGMGLVGDVFAGPNTLAQLVGSKAIGHNRYSTAGNNADSASAERNI